MGRETYEPIGVETLVATIPMTDCTELRVTHIAKPDKTCLVDVRQWYCTRKDPTMKPNTKGIRVSADFLPALVEALQQTVLMSKLG